MGQSLLGAGGPNIFQRSPTDCRLTKTLGSCDKVFSTMKALYFLIRVIVTRKVWEVKPAATRWLENVANLISHHQYFAKCPPLKTVTKCTVNKKVQFGIHFHSVDYNNFAWIWKNIWPTVQLLGQWLTMVGQLFNIHGFTLIACADHFLVLTMYCHKLATWFCWFSQQSQENVFLLLLLCVYEQI